MKERFIRQGSRHILYDMDAVPQFSPDWFDPEVLKRAVATRKMHAGRTSALFFEMWGGEFVLKHYQRGGLPGRFLRDSYFYLSEIAVRSFREWRMLVSLRRLGLPAPAPCAAGYRRVALGYTAALITRHLPAEPLSQTLVQSSLPAEQWHALGTVLRRFHRHGVYHADLNAHNVLINADQGHIFLIDFDRARLMASDAARLKHNLHRLRRSLNKLKAQRPDLKYEERDFSELLAGYRD